MAKTRVYELAKELGVESKTVLSTLKDMGEFVRSASSTIEPPVERRLKEKFGSDGSCVQARSEERCPQSSRPRCRRVASRLADPSGCARPDPSG